MFFAWKAGDSQSSVFRRKAVWRDYDTKFSFKLIMMCRPLSRFLSKFKSTFRFNFFVKWRYPPSNPLSRLEVNPFRYDFNSTEFVGNDFDIITAPLVSCETVPVHDKLASILLKI